MRVLHLTGTDGMRVFVGFPEEVPFFMRAMDANPKGPARTFINFGSLYARVRETPREVLDMLEAS